MSAFAGRVVVVTGASSGIGRALCLELAQQRPRLVLAGRDGARLEEVALRCRERGAETLVVKADVASTGDCRHLIERAVERYGALDVLVNNAGIGMIARFDELEDMSVYERLMRVNYLGCVYLTHAALPHLRKTHGLIVAVASVAGFTGVPMRSGYVASKHAMIGFFDSLRIELLGTGVDVCIVCPDFVVSEIRRRAIGPEGRALGKSKVEDSRIMSTEECARRIAGAMARRRRMLVMSLRGRLGRIVRLFAPGLIDKIALRAVREINNR